VDSESNDEPRHTNDDLATECSENSEKNQKVKVVYCVVGSIKFVKVILCTAVL